MTTLAKTSEHDEQVELFRLAEMHTNKHPSLALLFAIPNAGKRSYIVGARMKAEGLRAGVPDIFLPAVRYCKPECEMLGGLFIEMKIKGNRPTMLQRHWQEALRYAGYRVVVAYGWQEAWDAICDYLGIVPE